MTDHDAMMHPGGAIHHASITAPDAPGNIAELQPDVHGQGSEGGSGNAPPHSHGNNGSQVNSTVAPNEDYLGLPEVSRNYGQAVASLTANSGEPPAHGNNNHSIPGDAGEHGSNPSHGAPSNAHGMSGGGGNAPSHSHGNNGSQANFTVALNDDNLGVPKVSGNHGQAVASLVANSGEPPAHGNNHSNPGDAGQHGANPSHGAPSNAHGMSGGGGNAPSHSHGNNGSQANPTIALNDDNLGAPEVSGNYEQSVASLAANSGEPRAHGNNNHSIPGDASEHGTDPSHGAPPSNAHGMSGSGAAGTPGLGDSFSFNHEIAGSEGSGGNAPSDSHGNGSQMNSTVALNKGNLGVADIRGNQGQTSASSVADAGEPPTNGNSIPGDEHGAAQSHGAPSSNPPGLAHSAAAGTPGLGDSFQFNHEIAGSVSSGIIELASLDAAAALTGRHANAAGNGQAGESQIIELSLPGNSADHFQGHPGNTHAQHDLIV